MLSIWTSLDKYRLVKDQRNKLSRGSNHRPLALDVERSVEKGTIPD